MAPAGSRRIRILGVAVVVWTLLWIALGTVTFFEVRGLRSLSTTMGIAGQSLHNAGDALNAVASLPLVGGGVQPTADEIQRLARRAISEAQASRSHIDRLSVLALIMGGVIPVVAGLVVYVLLRRRWTESPVSSQREIADTSP